MIEINVHEKELCVKLVIYKDYIEMHGQQNIKKNLRKVGVAEVRLFHNLLVLVVTCVCMCGN